MPKLKQGSEAKTTVYEVYDDNGNVTFVTELKDGQRGNVVVARGDKVSAAQAKRVNG